MRNYINIKNLVVGSFFGLALMAGTVMTASAQNTNAEYREWQKAQRQAQKEQRDYQRSRSQRDYREWQAAQQRVNEEYAEYQRSQVDPYYRNNDRVGGNGYYNNNNNNNNVNRQYRVYRNGSTYTTDSRGAELLRQAVNSGYQQGYRQAQQDRQYGRGSNYNNSNVYRNGTYGYQSHVARNQYQYYFQQGFQRGYQDGYNNSTQYGYRSGNNFNILGTILNTILNFSN